MHAINCTCNHGFITRNSSDLHQSRERFLSKVGWSKHRRWREVVVRVSKVCVRLKRRELLAQKISLLAGQEHYFVFRKSHELRVLVIFNALLKLKKRQPAYDSADSMFTSAELCIGLNVSPLLVPEIFSAWNTTPRRVPG